MKALIAALIATTALSAAAQAADLPTRKAPMAPPPIASTYNWGGFYLGAYGGGAIGPWNETDTDYPSFTSGNNLSASGATFGGLAGYNFQFNSLVLGVEGDLGWQGVKGKVGWAAGSGACDGACAGAIRQTNWSSDYIGRIRGRLGYGFDRLLVFAAGGASFSDYTWTFSNPSTGYADSWKGNYTGFNVGGGVEYAFTNNIIGRLEYIYDGFPDVNISGHVAGRTADWDARRASFSQNTARVALEYKF